MELGIRQANGTFTGILGMLQEKMAVAYFRGQPDYLHEDWILKSIPVAMETIVSYRSQFLILEFQNDQTKTNGFSGLWASYSRSK